MGIDQRREEQQGDLLWMFPLRINRYHGCSTFPLQAKTTTETGEVMIPLKRNETDSVTCVCGWWLFGKNTIFYVYRFSVNGHTEQSCIIATANLKKQNKKNLFIHCNRSLQYLQWLTFHITPLHWHFWKSPSYRITHLAGEMLWAGLCYPLVLCPGITIQTNNCKELFSLLYFVRAPQFQKCILKRWETCWWSYGKGPQG